MRVRVVAIITAVAALTALALAPTALATEAVPNQALSQRVAAETYPPLCSPVVIKVGPLQNGPLAAAEAFPTDCSITFAPGVYLSHPDEICGEMVHEYGHLAGYYDPIGIQRDDGTIDHAHSPDPESIMYPVAHDYQPCNDLGDAALSAVDQIHWFRHVVADRQRVVRRTTTAARGRAQRLLARARARLNHALRQPDPAAAQYVVDLRQWSRRH